VVIVLPACQRELQRFPEEIRGDLADALARLEAGQTLAMPLSRPMPIIGNGVHELRLKGRSGAYRVFYVLPGAGIVYVLHASQKKTQATPKNNLDLARKRLKELKL
jgi:phage-related protein